MDQRNTLSNPARKVRANAILLCLLVAIFQSGCAYNGTGVGFERALTETPDGVELHISGFGFYTNLHPSYSSFGFGYLDTRLLCPMQVDTYVELNSVNAGTFENSSEYHPQDCEATWALWHEHYGVDISFANYGLRLVLGGQQKHIYFAKSDVSAVYQINLDTENTRFEGKLNIIKKESSDEN